MFGSQDPKELDPGHPRHPDIREDTVDAIVAYAIQEFLCRSIKPTFHSFGLEEVLQGLPKVLIVIDNCYRYVFHGWHGLRRTLSV